MNVEQFRGMTLTGGYTVHNEEALGKGGFGVVYKATYEQDQSEVGVKILLGGHDTPPNEQLQKGFKKEAQINSHLEHPHIARFLWYDVEHIVNPHLQTLVEEYPFIVLAFANQGSLGKLLEKQPLLPTEQTVDFLSQAAEGLQYAHERRVLHRDIKPHNFLLHKPHPREDHVDLWVADFGIAITAHDVNTPEPITPQETIGTFKYESAEQFEGKAVKQSDIYSLGVVAYQLLTGTLPFTANNFAEYYLAHKQKTPSSFAEARRESGHTPDTMVDALEEAVMKALEKNPQARYHSMSDLSQALQEAYTKAIEEAEKQRRAFEAAKPHMQEQLPEQAEVPEKQKIPPTVPIAEDVANHIAKRQERIDVLRRKLEGLEGAKYPRHNSDEMLAISEQLIAIDPQNSLGFAWKGYILTQYAKRHEEALVALDKAISLNPKESWAFSTRGRALTRLKRPEEAIAMYDEVIKLKPTDFWAYTFKGWDLKRLEREEEIIQVTDTLIRNNPNDIKAFLVAGNILYDPHEKALHEKAVAVYNEGLRLEGDLKDKLTMYQSLGRHLEILQRYEEALEVYDEWCKGWYKLVSINGAFERRTDLVYPIYSKFRVLESLNKYEEALNLWDETIKLNPTDFFAYYHKGNVLEHFNKYEEALKAYQKALEIYPEYKEAKRGLENLKKKLQKS